MKLRPMITEKTVRLAEEFGKYTFRVPRGKLNKYAAKSLIMSMFKVTVTKVNLSNIPGKEKRRGRHFGKTESYKKIIVSLKKGDKIEEFKVSK